jgi:hypothetical protein
MALLEQGRAETVLVPLPDGGRIGVTLRDVQKHHRSPTQ